MWLAHASRHRCAHFLPSVHSHASINQTTLHFDTASPNLVSQAEGGENNIHLIFCKNAELAVLHHGHLHLGRLQVGADDFLHAEESRFEGLFVCEFGGGEGFEVLFKLVEGLLLAGTGGAGAVTKVVTVEGRKEKRMDEHEIWILAKWM